MRFHLRNRMRFSRRIFFQLATGTAGLSLMPSLASAEVYPSRPVRMIVDVPAGLAPDVLAPSTSYGRHRTDTPFW